MNIAFNFGINNKRIRLQENIKHWESVGAGKFLLRSKFTLIR